MQTISLFHESFQALLRSDFENFKSLAAEKQNLEDLIVNKEISPQRAAQQLLDAYHQQIKNTNWTAMVLAPETKI